MDNQLERIIVRPSTPGRRRAAAIEAVA